MEELLRLTRENNEMLKRICAYIDKVDSASYRDMEDAKQLIFNIISDLGVENIANRQNTIPPRLRWK